MQDLPLADLDAFTAVARERSFSGRGSQARRFRLFLERSAAALEGRLGVRLLNRTTRSVTLTEAGEGLMERLSPALSEVAVALDQVGSFRDSATGTLRLNVPTVVARCILPQIAAEFLKAYPGVTLEVTAEDNFIDVLAAGFDAGIRYDESVERDMIAVPIGPRTQRFVTAAAPSYLASRGTPRHPRDVLDHNCIRHRFASGRVAPWEFENGSETIRLSPAGCLLANTTDLEVAAAVAGLGLIRGFEEFLSDALQRGDLVTVLDDWDLPFSGPYLYYASRRHMPAPLRAFIDFIKGKPKSSG